MLQNNQVRTEIQKFGRKIKCSVQVDQDGRFLYIKSSSRFYKAVFEEGWPQIFRKFCELLREYDYVYFPTDRDLIAIGSLDIIDSKRKQIQEVANPKPQIKYSEDDVLS